MFWLLMVVIMFLVCSFSVCVCDFVFIFLMWVWLSVGMFCDVKFMVISFSVSSRLVSGLVSSIVILF